MKAKEILEIYNKWKHTDQKTIAENLVSILDARGYDTWNSRLKVLSGFTGTKRDGVYAWLNQSRDESKVPFIKVCMIADGLGIEIERILGVK